MTCEQRDEDWRWIVANIHPDHQESYFYWLVAHSYVAGVDTLSVFYSETACDIEHTGGS